MKVSAALLLLAFAALQPLSITDCPCGFLCGHKNAFETTKNAVVDDCCARSSEGAGVHHPEPDGDRCFHVEPQTELTTLTPVLVVDPALMIQAVVEVPILPIESGLRRLSSSGPSPPFRESPLFLLHSRLQI